MSAPPCKIYDWYNQLTDNSEKCIRAMYIEPSNKNVGDVNGNII